MEGEAGRALRQEHERGLGVRLKKECSWGLSGFPRIRKCSGYHGSASL